MSQSLAEVWIHLVFSTRYRQDFLLDKAIRKEVHAYLVGIIHKLGGHALSVGGVEDHVHLLFRSPKTIALSDLVLNLKKDSSKWVKKTFPKLNKFYWQQGYGAFSVSPRDLKKVQTYINNQESHHTKISFKDEFIRFLNRYGIEYDLQYLWD